MTGKTREPQYSRCLELKERNSLTRLGLMSSQAWHDDPKRLTFLLSRYKFAAKMLAGSKHVLEIGCADAFATRIVQQAVQSVTAVDFDQVFVDDVLERMDPDWRFECRLHDILEGPVPGEFDAAFSMDVLEHIPSEKEDTFMINLCGSVTTAAKIVIGTPSIHSQAWASALSRQGHVNCKDHEQLRVLLAKYFQHVFLFSMNDEVVHTGFYPMAQYYMALCTGKK